MIVSSVLNNFQLATQAGQCQSDRIVSSRRLDKYHTEVVWDVDEKQFGSLRKLVVIRSVDGKPCYLRPLRSGGSL